MDRFILTDDLLTGADDIDAQHRQLFELANRVIECESSHGPDGEFFAAIAFLSDYVSFHFAAEEFAMRESSYPEIALHLRAHEDFRGVIGEIVEVALEVSSIAELRQRLSDVITGWLTAHIRETDKALARHLRRCAMEGIGGWPTADQLMAAGAIDDRMYAAAAPQPKT